MHKIEILFGLLLFCFVASAYGEGNQGSIKVNMTNVVMVIHDNAYSIAGVCNLSRLLQGNIFVILSGIPLTIIEGAFIKYLSRKIIEHSWKYDFASNNPAQNVTQIITVQ